MKNLFITRLFFALAFVGVFGYGLGYLEDHNRVFSLISFISKIVLIGLDIAFFVDILLLFIVSEPLSVNRQYILRQNLGDPFQVQISLINQMVQPIHLRVFEGYPDVLQFRNKSFNLLVGPRSRATHSYELNLNKRGKFDFKPIHVFLRSPLFLIQRRIVFDLEQSVEIYPSVLQMKKYELKVFNPQSISQGIKKVRRLGNASEFEQIRNYVQGDDIRTINWKATSRKNELMVNQFQEERSQAVYCLLDKSRPMQLSFNEMSMLDYAVNASLVFSNIVLRKGDRAGLITFSDKLGNIVPAEKSSGQIKRILETLYNQQTKFHEADYELLYQSIRRSIKTRSLLMLFTNFESEFAMRRVLPMLQKINKRHVLVVVFFQNNELTEFSQQDSATYHELINRTVAEKMMNQKWSMARELRQHGIQTILTKPEDLSINTINKYLEMKAKGVI